MINKKLLALLSVLALVALMQHAECRTLSKATELGYKLPDEAIEGTTEEFKAGRLYKRSSDDNSEESDEEDEEEVEDQKETSVDLEEEEKIEASVSEAEENEDEDEAEETTTKMPELKKGLKSSKKECFKTCKGGEDKKSCKTECIQNLRDAKKDKNKNQVHHHHHSDKKEASDSDHHHHSEHIGLNFTEAELDEHHHHHAEENATEHDFSVPIEIHNHHTDEGLSDAEIHHKYHHHHDEAEEAGLNSTDRHDHHHHHNHHHSNGHNCTCSSCNHKNHKHDGSSKVFKFQHKGQRKNDSIKIKIKLDSSNCDANFSSSELAGSIVNIIKDAVRSVQKEGVVNIFIQAKDSSTTSNSTVLSETIVLKNEATTEAPTEVPTEAPTEAPTEETTDTGVLEKSGIEAEPDYVDLEVNVPI